MRRLIVTSTLLLGILSSISAFATEQKITLRVGNMYCASCPFIVKQTLARVPGVSSVEISYEKNIAVAIAVVVYNDDITDVLTLTNATSDVGFPSTTIQSAPL